MAKWEKARCGVEVLDVNQAFDVAIGSSKGLPTDIVDSERLAWYLTNKINDMLIACIGLEERLSDYARTQYREHIEAHITNQEPTKLETMRNSLMKKIRAQAFVAVV